jgi:hypothetical protein
MKFIVMPGLVPGIHVLTAPTQERRGWPGHSPAMTTPLMISASFYKLARRRANHRLTVQPFSQKYCLFSFHPNHFHSLAIPAHTEGRFAIVTDVGLGMRWTR